MSKMGQLTYFSHSYKFIQRQICLPIDVSEFGFAWLVHVFYLFIWLLTPPYLVQSAGATKISVVLVATGTGEVIVMTRKSIILLQESRGEQVVTIS